ncbi:MAG: hypothetical protein ACTSXT_16215 [Candidatus Helarchaeota archaeon]
MLAKEELLHVKKLLSLNKYDEAMSYINNLVEEFPNDARLYYLLAIVYYKKNNEIEYIKFLNKSASLGYFKAKEYLSRLDIKYSVVENDYLGNEKRENIKGDIYKKNVVFFKRKNKILILLIFFTILLPIFLIPKYNNSITMLENNYLKRIKDFNLKSSEELNFLKTNYEKEIEKYNQDGYRDKLYNQANEYYRKIWYERSNYNSRYAITPRERAQLEMLALSKDRTKNIEGIVRSIAIKAAPKNSTINVYTTRGGLWLDIDFDMSELSYGEFRSRTKHLTIKSLREEVIRLISRVTNDVYRVCQDLDLKTISIGCRHYVIYYDLYNSSNERNIVLYKIRLDKKDIKELNNNPFLDIYSTTKYFKVEKDRFPELNINSVKKYYD